jgi:hypothetical protein
MKVKPRHLIKTQKTLSYLMQRYNERNGESQISQDSELSSIVELPIQDNKTNTVFDMLPDEAMVKIWSFLDAPTLGKAAQVCKRFKRISYDVPVWRDMARKRRWDMHKPGTLLISLITFIHMYSLYSFHSFMCTLCIRLVHILFITLAMQWVLSF